MIITTQLSSVRVTIILWKYCIAIQYSYSSIAVLHWDRSHQDGDEAGEGASLEAPKVHGFE